MFKQIILPILAVVVFIIAVGVFVQKSSIMGIPGVFTPQPSTPPQKVITVGSVKINVQIADTQEKRKNGLSGVKSLKTDEGMLFVFESKGVTPLFWMKDMVIPIDIIWIRNGKITRIDKSVPIPTPGTSDSNLKTYSAGAPVDYVLEVGAGFSDQNKVKVGDTIDLTGI